LCCWPLWFAPAKFSTMMVVKSRLRGMALFKVASLTHAVNLAAV
jgi:hypothetical protein